MSIEKIIKKIDKESKERVESNFEWALGEVLSYLDRQRIDSEDRVAEIKKRTDDNKKEADEITKEIAVLYSKKTMTDARKLVELDKIKNKFRNLKNKPTQYSMATDTNLCVNIPSTTSNCIGPISISA